MAEFQTDFRSKELQAFDAAMSVAKDADTLDARVDALTAAIQALCDIVHKLEDDY